MGDSRDDVKAMTASRDGTACSSAHPVRMSCFGVTASVMVASGASQFADHPSPRRGRHRRPRPRVRHRVHPRRRRRRAGRVQRHRRGPAHRGHVAAPRADRGARSLVVLRMERTLQPLAQRLILGRKRRCMVCTQVGTSAVVIQILSWTRTQRGSGKGLPCMRKYDAAHGHLKMTRHRCAGDVVPKRAPLDVGRLVAIPHDGGDAPVARPRPGRPLQALVDNCRVVGRRPRDRAAQGDQAGGTLQRCNAPACNLGSFACHIRGLAVVPLSS